MFLATRSDDTTAAAAAALAGFGLFGVLFVLGFFILGLVVNWMIASKAGYNGVLSLLMFIPFVNLIVLLIFAFSKWPVQRELELLRAGTGSWPGGPVPGAYGSPDLTQLPTQPS
jgi:hypothetical protein